MSTKQRLDKHEERLDRHDKQIAAIRDLIREGMRLVVLTRKDLHRLAQMQIKNEEMQRRTEASLRDFIESLKRGGNGHAKRRLDIK